MTNGKQTRRNIKLETKTTYPKDFDAPGVYDLCQTPSYAVEPLLKYIPKDWLIWESAAGEGYLLRAIQSAGFDTVESDIQTGENYFYYRPVLFDCQITNPPYSLKLEWVQRAYELNKPWALLMPVDAIGGGKMQRLFGAYGVEIIYLDKRVDFQTVNTTFEESQNYFAVAWYTWGLNIGQQITFETILKRPEEQMILQFDTPHQTAIDSQGQRWQQMELME